MSAPAPVTVRPRRDDDLRRLVEVLAAQQPTSRYPLRWPLPFPPEHFVRRATERSAWVAEVDGTVVGHVSLTQVLPDDPFAEQWSRGAGRPVAELLCVSVLFVAHDVVGSGVGGRLLDVAVSAARGEGAAPVLDVVQRHSRAAAVYRHRGWVEVGTGRPDWLGDDEPDVLLMVLPDGVAGDDAPANDRSAWLTTTHRWSNDVDGEHLAQVRERLSRPGVAGGRRHLILEVLAYADDEAARLGRVGTAVVTTHPDGTVTISDDGRGTDTRRDGQGRVVRKPVMATPDVRFQDEAAAPLLPDGLPRRGMSSVAALSSVLVHENRRADGSWSQTYRHGLPDRELAPVAGGGRPGTNVSFRADLDGPVDLTPEDLHAFRWLRVELGT